MFCIIKHQEKLISHHFSTKSLYLKRGCQNNNFVRREFCEKGIGTIHSEFFGGNGGHSGYIIFEEKDMSLYSLPFPPFPNIFLYYNVPPFFAHIEKTSFWSSNLF
jgi:hypothetical protein